MISTNNTTSITFALYSTSIICILYTSSIHTCYATIITTSTNSFHYIT